MMSLILNHSKPTGTGTDEPTRSKMTSSTSLVFSSGSSYFTLQVSVRDEGVCTRSVSSTLTATYDSRIKRVLLEMAAWSISFALLIEIDSVPD